MKSGKQLKFLKNPGIQEANWMFMTNTDAVRVEKAIKSDSEKKDGKKELKKPSAR